jgi:hypothetical protein
MPTAVLVAINEPNTRELAPTALRASFLAIALKSICHDEL